jgi:hypothetical protein|tara:strand:+ start:895 stop:2127 length:1233 start_codon:yes stop_codon:yes gene_type:complete
MGLITETNAQYYAGQQVIGTKTQAAPGDDMVIAGWSFNTDPISAYGLPKTGFTPNIKLTQISAASNFNVYFAPAATPNAYTAINQDLVYVSNANTKEITIISPANNTDYNGSFYFQLTQQARNNNNGNYEYIGLNEIINNFIVAYIGVGKLILNAKRTDIMFHAKRGLQEFSYDTLRSIKSQELTIPPSLAITIPQDYVNYVKLSWVDQAGVKHIIYPTTLTSNPTELPIQDDNGEITQNSFGGNNEAQQSKIEERWKTNNSLNITGQITNEIFENADVYGWGWDKLAYGQRYGLEPEVSQKNGWFTINERTGSFNFSSTLAGKLIILEYISDGLAINEDTKVPKMAEEAMYMHIAYSILSGRANVPEYIVRRFKKDRSSALRNAKIRLSNIKLEEFTQVMRGKSKWIKH